MKLMEESHTENDQEMAIPIFPCTMGSTSVGVAPPQTGRSKNVCGFAEERHQSSPHPTAHSLPVFVFSLRVYA